MVSRTRMYSICGVRLLQIGFLGQKMESLDNGTMTGNLSQTGPLKASFAKPAWKCLVQQLERQKQVCQRGAQ